MKDDTGIIIEIPPNGVDAVVSLSNGEGKRTVPIGHIVSELTSFYRFGTGLLPHNTRFFHGIDKDYTIGVDSPRQVRTIHCRNDGGSKNKFLRVPYPACLCVFRVQNNRIVETKVFALKEELRDENTKLYRFPFGNTSRGGRVCWGNVAMPPIAIPNHIAGVVTMFFDTIFNDHLMDGNTFNSPKDKRIAGFWGLVEYLDKKDRYPDSMLCDTNITAGQFMR